MLASLKKIKGDSSSRESSPTTPKRSSSSSGTKKRRLLWPTVDSSALHDELRSQLEDAPIETAALLEDVAHRKERVAALEDEIRRTRDDMADLVRSIERLQEELHGELVEFDQHRSVRNMSGEADLDKLLEDGLSASLQQRTAKKAKRFEVPITEKEARANKYLFCFVNKNNTHI